MIEVSAAMQDALDAQVQRPIYALLSYDVTQSTGETWGSILSGTSTQVPVDLSAFVEQINWGYDQMTVTLTDELFQFHPDTGALRCILAPGRAIRLLEGREGIPQNKWISLFFGPIKGPYNWAIERGTMPLVRLSVFTRDTDQAWRRRRITSKAFTIGSDWSLMFRNIAQDIMGMTDAEIAVPHPWHRQFDKTSNQIVDLPPWEALEALTQGDFSRIWFNGSGQLSRYTITLDHIDQIVTAERIVNYAQPGNNTESPNKITVTYLDNKLTKVVGAKQSLGTANLTAGFFDFKTELDVFYSEDKKQRAENVSLIVKQSINQNDLGISIGSEKLTIKDEFGGKLVITVDAWVSALATAGIAGVLSGAAVPDGVVVAGLGASTGVTIPIGKIVMGIAIVAVLLAMMILGNGIYEIVGNPFDMAFLEKQAIAILDGIPFWEEIHKQIRNEFISEPFHADQLAVNELLFEQSMGKPRTLIMENDPRIERGDVLQLPTGIKFFVLSASKTITRGGTGQLSLTGFKSVV